MKLQFFKQLFNVFCKAINDTINHDGVEHAGYLAFLAILSLFPFLVFFVALAGTIGQSESGVEIINFILSQDLLPQAALDALTPRIEEIVSGPPQSLVTLAVVGAIWTASSAVEGLKTILNRAYRVETPPAYIFRRLMSIAEFLIMTILLTIAMFILVLSPVIFQNVVHYLEMDHAISGLSLITDWNWSFIRYALTSGILFAVVSSLYYVIPNINQTWKSVYPGAITVVIGWMGVGILFSIYLNNFQQVNVIYGSLGGVIVSLLFFYVLAMVLVFGAEFNYSINKTFGEKLQPKKEV
jgi:membrane protein